MEGTTHVIGVLYVTLLFNTETNEQLVFEHECIYPGDALPAPPERPPSQPEFLEAAAQVLVVDPEVNPNPAWGGITGVETWLWCTDPDDLDVGVSLRGWTAAATMSAVQYHWVVTGPTPASFQPTDCGSEGSPAAMWMPETMGPHVIEVAVTWAGTWTLSYAGIPMGTFVLGPFDIDGEPIAYPVGEYVGILTDGSDQ